MSRNIGSLPCGAKIRFGAYSVGNEGSHSINWIKMSTEDTVFLSEFIEDFRAFDASEPENPDEYRRDYGNNRYSVSNIDLFLNSSEENWYSPQHEYDTAPMNDRVRWTTPYADQPGFLCMFKDYELEAILDTPVTVALPTKDNRRIKSETIVRKVFLPSVMNIFGEKIRDTEEGEYWEYFKRGASRRAIANDYAIKNTTMTGGLPEGENRWFWLLRSPFANDSYSVRYVGQYGDLGYCSAFNGCLGVRPALRLNPEILISDEPDDEGYYEIIQSGFEPIEVSKEDFLALFA